MCIGFSVLIGKYVYMKTAYPLVSMQGKICMKLPLELKTLSDQYYFKVMLNYGLKQVGIWYLLCKEAALET